MTDDAYVTVANVGDIQPGGLMYVEVGEDPVCLVNLDGEFFALGDLCTHEEASLSEGMVIGDELECPLHGGAFEIRTGKPAALPVVVPAQTYRVRVVGDDVQVAKPA